MEERLRLVDPSSEVMGESARQNALLCIASALGYMFVFYVVSPWMFDNFVRRTIPDLSEEVRLDWHSRTNSNLNAVLVCTFAGIGFIQDFSLLRIYPCVADNELIKVSAALLCGYSIADIYLSLAHYEQIGSPSFLFHHTVAAYSTYSLFRYEVMQFFVGLRILSELSTPFVNMRWQLDTLKVPRTSALFITNGLLMTFAFGLCRISVIPLLWSGMYERWGSAVCMATGFMEQMVVAFLLLDVLNVFWFAKMLRIAAKFVRGVVMSGSDNNNVRTETSGSKLVSSEQIPSQQRTQQDEESWNKKDE